MCGHLASNHADPATGDTRCLADEDRRDLLYTSDDGRDTQHHYCACLHYIPAPAAHPPTDEPELSDYRSGLAAGLRAATRAVADDRPVRRLEDFR